MNSEKLNKSIEKALSQLPVGFDDLVQYGRAMENSSYNPEGMVPIREDLDERIKGALFYNFADGAGNSDSLWIIPTDNEIEALYLCFDHESDLNFYAYDKSEAYAYQSRLYSDLPLNLKKLLSDGREGELLTIKDPNSSCTLYHGSALFYLAQGEWMVPESYRALALDFEDNGGINYMFNPHANEEES